MPRFRNSGRTFSNRKSANRTWGGAVDTSSAIAGAGTKVLLGFLSLSNPGIEETILRTVGVMSMFTDQSAASEEQDGAFGMIVVNDRAITAGVASIPGPLTDISDDGWFVHIPFLNSWRLLSAVGFEAQNSSSTRFDFKSKRIVEDGFAIALVVESGVNSEGFTFNVILRLLSMVRGTG